MRTKEIKNIIWDIQLSISNGDERHYYNLLSKLGKHLSNAIQDAYPFDLAILKAKNK